MKLRTQLFVIFSLIIVVTVGTIGYFFYQKFWAIQLDRLRDTLTAYVTSASMLIDGDRHSLLTRPEDVNAPYFIELRNVLNRFRTIDPRIDSIYTMVRTDTPDIYRFVVDASEVKDKDGDGRIGDDERIAELGEEYNISKFPQMKKAFAGPLADKEINRDKWGWWLSAYAPVYDSKGKAVAIVGLDVSADTIRVQQVRLIKIILLICIAFLAIGLIVANVYAYYLTNPLYAMVKAAREIGKGNYDHRIVRVGKNELGFLAGTMNSMAENIRRSFDKLSTLNRTANILASTLDLEQALRMSLNLALEVTRSSKGVILLPDRTERRIEIAISEGIEVVRCDADECRVGSGTISLPIEEGQEAPIDQWLALTGCTNCFPLTIKDTVRGYFLLNPEIHDEEFLNTLMKQISFAIENARLFHEAITDGLTGLFLKRYFQIQLEIELKRVQRHRRPMSLLMLDIDHFKAINDTYGHVKGDVILREVSRLVKSCVRETDIASRYGGEELAVILPETPSLEAAAIAERMRKEIAALRFPHDGTELSITMSVGVHSVEGGAEARSEEVIQKADAALYEAKKSGRNRVCVWGARGGVPQA
jgi:diguanylate cyclase (GGDEF)-like protein